MKRIECCSRDTTWGRENGTRPLSNCLPTDLPKVVDAFLLAAELATALLAANSRNQQPHCHRRTFRLPKRIGMLKGTWAK